MRTRPHVPTVVRGVCVSVPSLERALRFWHGTLGFETASIRLHEPDHEELWGLGGAASESATLWSGDFLIELKEYLTPAARLRPAGYLPSDQGILNVAIGSVDATAFSTLVDRLQSAGYRPNKEFLRVPNRATVVYFTDEQGFSVELMHVHPSGLAAMGFVLPNE